MASISSKLYEPLSDNLELYDINLLPLTIQKYFSISSNKAQCKMCHVMCIPSINQVFFHLSKCNGELIGEENISGFKIFKCLSCIFKTKHIIKWKLHFITPEHYKKSSSSISYSYNCDSCKTFLFGSTVSILQHNCRPIKLSILSLLMADVFKDFHSQQYFRSYSTDCSLNKVDLNYYSNTKENEHIYKNSKIIKNESCSTCNICQITFYEPNKGLYFAHTASYEHIMLWYIRGNRSINQNTSLKMFTNYISKYFEKSILLKQAQCIICHKIMYKKNKNMLKHHKNCIASKEVSFDNNLELILCEVCKFSFKNEQNNTNNQIVNDVWIKHVTSFNHLKNTIVYKIMKKEQLIYSYYCKINKFVLYGTESFINNHVQKGCFGFLSKVMRLIYLKHNNNNYNQKIFYCGICLNDKTLDCEHGTCDLTYYCSTCLIQFKTKSDYSDHNYYSEHIILKYYKPNITTDIKLMENSVGLLNLSKRRTSDINHIKCSASLSTLKDNTTQTNQVFNEIETALSNQIIDNNNLVHCETQPRTSNIANELINRLSKEQFKSSLNNFLRSNLESFNSISLDTNIFNLSKCFYCATCDIILKDEISWIKHDTSKHCKTKNPIIFYCSVCHIYQISKSVSLKTHLETTEHKVMIDFMEYLKKEQAKFKLNGNPKLPDRKDFTQAQHIEVIDTNIKPKKYMENRNIYLEVMSNNGRFKGNDNLVLKKAINDNYGDFKEISNKKNSFIILLNNLDHVESVLKDQNQLEKHFNIKIQTFQPNTENKLSLETKQSFSDWGKLCILICNLLDSMEKTKYDLTEIEKLNKICASVRKIGVNLFPDFIELYVFGSRIYGLAMENSDVDLFLDIGNTFNGSISEDCDKQVFFVEKFANELTKYKTVFKNIEKICDARVPIVKFYHIPTKLNCDISFKSGLSTHNTKLIDCYLSIHKNVRWIVCLIVKHWAVQNNLKHQKQFTNYALVWLVLFYLMTVNLVPPLIELMTMVSKKKRVIIEGWDCSFNSSQKTFQMGSFSKYSLLYGFFLYYSDEKKLKSQVLCTLTGKCMNKKQFFSKFIRLPEINYVQRTKLNSFNNKITISFNKSMGLAIQDPFDLSFNITKNINCDKLTHFCDLCYETIQIMDSMDGLDYK
ncbi:uncharacterized protein LOC126893621 [Daktulosphaira vitifoliae]|uniref:uncharacterized protein LOC126893621 n=1 Tax=Daktulosphaira vitifoliae TaxID=58002 RepID=UPI0021AAD5C4|nr:uncharacterized protein LOC126893621 [Daktulosphaira vitifoliae]